MIGVGFPVGLAVAVNTAVLVFVALAVDVMIGVAVEEAVVVKLGVFVFVAVKLEVAVGVLVDVNVAVGVGVFVTVEVAPETVTTAPFNGAPLKLTGPVPFVPTKSVTLAIDAWKVPFALPVKLSSTR
jgi:hypothetical protein